MKQVESLTLIAMLILALTACSSVAVAPAESVSVSQPTTAFEAESNAVVQTVQDSQISQSAIAVEYEPDDLNASIRSPDISYITLEGDAIAFDGSGATVDGSTLTITSAGVFSISGTLDDGQIIIDSAGEDPVRLILNGAAITASSSAPIYVANAEKTVITLAEGTENVVTDGDSYIFEDAETDEPNAAIFSKDDLTINGTGSLTVNANFNNGIASKDDLKITGGQITVNAVNDGMKGRDSIAVLDGSITINAGGDGLQATNTEDADKGNISIEGGTFVIKAELDGMQAESRLAVSGGDLTITTGGGSINRSGGMVESDWGWANPPVNAGSEISTKGLKAGMDVTISGGSIVIDSLDDALHSNNSLTIHAGEMTLASGDDGIHSDSTLEIYGGEIVITQSYEGLESESITIHDGIIHIASSDDGINAVGENNGAAMGGRPGQDRFNFSSDSHLSVYGGYITIDAGGDGIDINGSIDMSSGEVIINGPTSNNNGALDYLGTFNITGGRLIAVGSAGMAQAPGTSSTQHSVMVTFSSALAADTLVHIETDDGEAVLTFKPTKTYQSVVFSSPELKNGATYSVYTGGSSSGTATDGLYTDGTYTAGTQFTDFTISGIVTTAGSNAGGFPGGGGGRRPRP